MVGGETLSAADRCAARPFLLIVASSIQKSIWARRPGCGYPLPSA